ncbi:MAG: hypothetical protein JSV04_10200 [Candidatus Heimdallarchaeota archaeon]|nr:MAG: hypothetical protein JSV04_10200 [Candidatus Heimdallarchaeota archaeon]
MISKVELVKIIESNCQDLRRNGDTKTTTFTSVYKSLMPSQQHKLEELCGTHFQKFLEDGSIISLALAYSEAEILAIDQGKKKWEIYAEAYNKLNNELKILSEKVAIATQGIPILPTIDGIVGKISHVQEYFPMTISHRLIGEFAGMGWRGKNNLIIHPKFSCAFRFVSVLTPLNFPSDPLLDQTCEDCTACFNICSFLKKQSKLNDYRENCRKYIRHLDLSADVCGKCIKACYFTSKFNESFQLTTR